VNFLFILAVIPAFNEEKSIADVVQRTAKHVDCVVVVDDSSRDNTAELALLSGATVLRHSKNMGVGATMITGIEYAQKLRPDIVVTLDADGQHKPEEIPRLIRLVVAGKADCVVGSRFLQGSLANTSFIKRVGNKFFTFITNLLAGAKLTDTQTGFRALNKKALFALDLKCKFTYTHEMIIILSHKGCRIGEVPIRVEPRKQGNSKVTSNIFGYVFKSLAIVFSTYVRQKINK
jgi:glycosyltransferase involved in cell wall biosynthesis